MRRYGVPVGEEKEFHKGYSGKEKPVKEGEEYDVVIESVGAKGDGLARIGNFVVFVPGTSAGDNVHIKIREVHAKFALAEKTA